MKIHIGLVLFGFLVTAILAPQIASAETLSWEPPTTRVDGTPLDPVTDLSNYFFKCDGGIAISIPAVGDGTNTYPLTKRDIFPDYGTYDCWMTAVSTEQLESSPSNIVTIPYDPTKPNSPINLIILE